MSKSSNLYNELSESPGLVEPGQQRYRRMDLRGQTEAGLRRPRGDGFQPLHWNMYSSTWQRAFFLQNEHRWHRRNITPVLSA